MHYLFFRYAFVTHSLATENIEFIELENNTRRRSRRKTYL